MATQALLKAVTSARYTQTRLLLRMGADVNCQDPHSGQTPLIRALGLEDPRVRTSFLRLLLKAGAVVGQADYHKTNALMWCAKIGNVEDFLLLWRSMDDEDDFDLNGTNKAGRTVLWLAAERGSVEVVRELVVALSKEELGCEMADLEGVTPAWRAAALGHWDCIRTMIKYLQLAAATSHVAGLQLGRVKAVLRSAEEQSLEQQHNPVSNGHTCTTTLDSTSHNARPGDARCIGECEESFEHSVTFKLPVANGKSDPPAIRIYTTDGHQVGTINNNNNNINNKGKSDANNNYIKHNGNISDGLHKHSDGVTNKSKSTTVEFLCSPRPKTTLENLATGVKESSRNSLASHLLGNRSSSSLSGSSSNLHSKTRFLYSSSPTGAVAVGSRRNSVAVDSDVDTRSRMPSRCSTSIYSSWPGESEVTSTYSPQDLLPARVGSLPDLKGSVRDSLPGLFALSAQQSTTSFRKAAVRPPSISKQRASQKWSKLRGLTLVARGLGRHGSISSVASGRASQNGRSIDKPTGLAVLLTPRRKSSGTRSPLPGHRGE